jgi:hypothetical protein
MDRLREEFEMTVNQKDLDALYLRQLKAAGVTSGAVRGEEPTRVTVANAIGNTALDGPPPKTEAEFLERLAEAERTTGLRYGDDGKAA